MRKTRFNIEYSSKHRIEVLLRDMHDKGYVDYWGPSFPQDDPKFLSIDFGPNTNLVMVILQVNSRLLVES